MIKAKAISERRDKNNNILGYVLQDENGNLREIESDNLKYAMKMQRIDVENLHLTANNHLIKTSGTRTDEVSGYMVFIKSEYVRDSQAYTGGPVKEGIWDEANENNWIDTSGDVLVFAQNNTTLTKVKAVIKAIYPEADPEIFNIVRVNTEAEVR